MSTYLTQQLIEYCSPTIASIKVSNLFTVSNYDCLDDDIAEANEFFSKQGLVLCKLATRRTRSLLLLYRRAWLSKLLEEKKHKDFLCERGYSYESIEDALSELSTRFTYDLSFPHEIGVFLGYPIRDVESFIAEKGCNSKCTGCWKVYHQECEALNYFEKLEKCKNLYKKLYTLGYKLDFLLVKERSLA